jgi:hypothetical protein
MIKKVLWQIIANFLSKYTHSNLLEARAAVDFHAFINGSVNSHSCQYREVNNHSNSVSMSVLQKAIKEYISFNMLESSTFP